MDANGGNVDLFLVLAQADRTLANSDTGGSALGDHFTVSIVGM